MINLMIHPAEEISPQLYELIAEHYEPSGDMDLVYNVSGYTKEDKSRPDLLPNVTLVNQIYSREELLNMRKRPQSIIDFKSFDDWFIYGEEQGTGYTVFVMTEEWPWWALVSEGENSSELFLKIARKVWQWLPWRYLPLHYEDELR